MAGAGRRSAAAQLHGPGREYALHEPDGVGQADGDRRARRHPAAREQRGQTLHPLHEPGTSQRHLPARQRGEVRISLSKLAENGEKGSSLHLYRTYTRFTRRPSRPAVVVPLKPCPARSAQSASVIASGSAGR